MVELWRGLCLYAQLQWRPRTLGLAWICVLLPFASITRLGDGATAASAVLVGTASAAMAIGVLFLIARSEVAGLPMVRLLPNQLVRARDGAIALTIIVSFVAGVVAYLVADDYTAVLASGTVPILTCIGVTADLVRLHRRLGIAVLITATGLLAVRPDFYATGLTRAPLIAITLSVVATVMLFRYRFSERVNFSLVDRPSEGESGAPAGMGESHRQPVTALATSIGLRSVRVWVSAATRELQQFRWQSERPFVWTSLVGNSVLVCISYVFGMQWALIGLNLSQRGLQLRNTLLYPLSRRQRAHVRFFCALLENALLSVTTFVVLSVLIRMHFPRVTLADGPRGPLPVWLMAASLFAFGPLIQIGRAVMPAPAVGYRMRNYAWAVFGTLPMQLTPVFAIRRTPTDEAWRVGALLFVLAVVIYSAYYVLLRRLHQRVDLLARE